MAPNMPVRAAADQQQQQKEDDGVVAAWRESYPLPDEAEGSREDLKRLYRFEASGLCMQCLRPRLWRTADPSPPSLGLADVSSSSTLPVSMQH